MPIKIAFIGAGSVGFTRGLFRDVVAVPQLADTHFVFHDISEKNLDIIYQLCRKDIKSNKLPATIKKEMNRRKALEGADYVINCTRIGGMEAFQHDIDIPLKYGVDQCVGDTLCAGGIMYGQRNIPAILDFCKDMREVGSKDLLFLNYANPMAMNTWAAIKYGKINTVGLCHGVESGHHKISVALGAKSKSEVDVICAGINHQTWFIKILYQGREVTSEELLAGFQNNAFFAKTEKCRIDVLKRFGYFSTESNGHLSEYLPWYRKDPRQLKRWIDLSSPLLGETGGYLRACNEARNWFRSDFPRWMAAQDKPITYESRGGERGSYIIEALETGKIFKSFFNLQNNGTITNLPDDCIIEAPGFVDKLGIRMPKVGDLPLACAATCNASISVQRMSVEAAVSGDVKLLKQAMLHDPLIGAVCNPDEVWQMTDEMLVAHAPWLPQYQATGAIKQARKNLAGEKPLGTRSTKGAARLRTRTLDEMRALDETQRAAVMQADALLKNQTKKPA